MGNLLDDLGLRINPPAALLDAPAEPHGSIFSHYNPEEGKTKKGAKRFFPL